MEERGPPKVEIADHPESDEENEGPLQEALNAIVSSIDTINDNINRIMEEVAEINFKVNETCKDVKKLREKNGIESSSDSDN